MATPDDADAILAIYAPIVNSTTISFELEPPTREEMADRISKVLTAQQPWLIYEVGGHAIAYAYASGYRERPAYAWSVESSINVALPARGSGIGKRLYARLLAVLDAQGYRSVFASIAQPNPASNALHAKLGFSCVGTMRMAGFKHGAWRDVEWWQKQLDDSGSAPTTIRPLDAVGSVIASEVPY